MTQPKQSPFPTAKKGRPAWFSGAFLGVLLLIFLAAFAYASFLFFETARSIVLNAPQLANAGGDGSAEGGASALGEQVLAGSENQGNNIGFNQGNEGFVLPPLWDEQEPINILLLGIDQRPGQSANTRTDTIILVNFDPNTGNVGMLSLPRDLAVFVPGSANETTINAAHVIGFSKDNKHAGPDLVKDAVAAFLRYPVHYYVRVNFEGFRVLLDEVGCIDIDVPFDINDPEFPDDNYGYDPLFIAAGRQCMDAELALKYARTRHVDSDFGRMARQQQVLVAVKDKVLDTGQLPKLIPSLPTLLNAFGDAIQTDMPLNQQITLANLARKLDMANIRRLVIDGSMIEADYLANGKWVARAKMDIVQPAVDVFFNPGQSTVAPPENVDARQLLSEENAQIAVLNGTTSPDLAIRAGEWLAAQGYNVIGYANANRDDYAQTQVIDYGGKPATMRQLVNLLAVGDGNIRAATSADSQVDIQLILGADFNLPGQ